MEKKERIYYYLFEHNVLPKHLQEMASKGWMLCDIVDRGFYMVLLYQACEPRTCYFYTDVSDDTNQFLYDTISNEMEDYIQFVEDYGYCFITGKKGLMVYASDKHISIPIREEDARSKHIVRRATLKALLFPLFILLISTLSVYSRISLFVRDPLLILENNSALLNAMSSLCTFVLFLYMLSPALHWWVFHKVRSSFRYLRIRFYLIFVGLLCLFGSILIQLNEATIMMLGIIFIPTCIFAWLYNYIIRFHKAVIIGYCIIVFISMVSIISQSSMIVQTYASITYTNNSTSSIFLIREDKDYITENGGKQTIINYHVKDTVLKPYIQSLIEKKQQEYNTLKEKEGTHSIITFNQ